MGFFFGLILAYILGYAGYLMDVESVPLFSSVPEVFSRIMEYDFFYPITGSSILGFVISLVIACVMIVFMQISSEQNYSFTKDAISGTGGFMPQKQLKEYSVSYVDAPETYKDPITKEIDKDVSNNIILTNSFYRSMDDMKTWKNNNVLCFGGAGTGKSRFFIKPNILQLNASYVVTDPSGEILASVGNVLVNHGYVIKIFNISDMRHSNRYNPLYYIRDEAGVLMLIECLINNTSKEDAAAGDNQFFVDAEKLLYAACIFYLRDELQSEKDTNFATVFDMVNQSAVDETNAGKIKSELDKKFEKIKNKSSSLAWKYYSAFKQAAGKTLKAIIISCIVRLQYFQIPQVKKLTGKDDLELDSIGDRKTALFIITPQADRTYSFLAAMLYSQLFERLYYLGEERVKVGKSPRSTYPVRCLMDEFANSDDTFYAQSGRNNRQSVA